MDNVNIKDYLKVNTEVPTNKRTRSAGFPTYDYEIILDNGCDVIIRRISGTGIKRDLTIIPSDNLVFIRDVKKGIDKFVTGEGQITQFFQDVPHNFFEQLKNSFWHCTYSSAFSGRVMSLKSSRLIRAFLKKGLNPRDIFGNYPSSSTDKYLSDEIIESPAFTKIFNKLIEIQSKDSKMILEGLFVISLEISERLNFNNAIWMLDRLKESNSKCEISAFKGYYGHLASWIPNLIEKYNLNFQSLINYLFFDLYAQGINCIDDDIITIYDDTLNMQTLMYNGKVREKYPKHLKETHDKVTLIYNLNQQYFDHQQAVKLHNECKNLEFSDSEYCIVTPEDSSELIDEGISLHHCVGSYVDRVNAGKTSILFLRRVDAPDESLITIEYQDGSIKQVRGLCERLMNDKERKFFTKWTKKFKINVDRE